MRYTYDLSGNRATRTVLSGAHADYDNDDLNRIRGQTNYFANGQAGRFDYGFDAMGRRRYEQRDWSVADGYEHDPTDQITGYQRDGTLNGDGTVTAGFSNSSTLAYDGTGNRTQVTGLGGSSYGVNSLNQYTSASNVSGLGYDPKGNLTSADGWIYSYDPKGNLTSADGWIYSYDAQNRLTRMEKPGTVIVMTYDPLNRIITRNVNGAVTQNVWEGWNLIEEHRPDWSIQRCYLAGANQNEMVAAFDGNVYTTHSFWQDGRGNTSHITGDPGNILERYTYDLSGAPKFYDENGWERFESAYDTRFLFAGSQYMQGTGLYDMRNRFYHITLNRFLQADPIGFMGDRSNLYRYCHNDPADFSDATGLNPEPYRQGPLTGWGGGDWIPGMNGLSHNDILDHFPAGNITLGLTSNDPAGKNDNAKFYGSVRRYTRMRGIDVETAEIGRAVVTDARDAAKATARTFRPGRGPKSGRERAYAEYAKGGSLVRNGPRLGEAYYSGHQTHIPPPPKGFPDDALPVSVSHSHGPGSGRGFQGRDLSSSNGADGFKYISAVGYYGDNGAHIVIHVPYGGGYFHSTDGANFYSGTGL